MGILSSGISQLTFLPMGVVMEALVLYYQYCGGHLE